MTFIKSAVEFAESQGLDCYPIGVNNGNHTQLENAIAVVGFEQINDVFKKARHMGGTVCLFKNLDSDLFECLGDIDQVLHFLSNESGNELQLIKGGTLYIVGVKVDGDSNLQINSYVTQVN